jgi:hypothetical protein
LAIVISFLSSKIHLVPPAVEPGYTSQDLSGCPEQDILSPHMGAKPIPDIAFDAPRPD